MPVELASELLAGPDLGGGFLFQLSRDRPPLLPGFTFHIQGAGTDAGVEPAGSPASLGYAHPPSACMYGGPGCWHRSFRLAESEAGRVRVAYNRTRFVISPLLAQAEHRRPAPVAQGLKLLLDRISRPLTEEGIPWQLGGSAAAWLRGAQVAPADLDIGIAEGHGERISELLEEFAIEPLHPEPRPGHEERTAGAAFLGSFVEGIRAEWATMGARIGPAGIPDEWGGAEWVERRELARWEGFTVPLAPLEFELARLAESSDEERFATFLRSLPKARWDLPLIERLLAARPVAPGRVAQLRAAIAASAPP